MASELEKICTNCHSFRPVSYDAGEEKGICLQDPDFGPYLDEIIEQDDFTGCHQLVREKIFSGERTACTSYDEVDYPEDSLEELDLKQESDELPIEMLGYNVDKITGYSFIDHSFSWLLEHDERLLELRRRFEGKSAEERRRTADFEYHASAAEQMISEAVGEATPPDDLPGAVIALAIDPCYAPALLTVGTHEILLGRIEEGMSLLFSLLDLPGDTEELHIIIDKAGRFLLDRLDSSRALVLYEKAVKMYPDEQLFQTGVAACSPRKEE